MFDRTMMLDVDLDILVDAERLTNKIVPTNGYTKSWIDHSPS